MPTEPAVTLESVSKVYGSRWRRGTGERHAVDGVSLGFDAGRVVALMGPNGSGKSTLLRMIAGTLSATSGVVRVLGHAAGNAAARRGTGMVFQDPAVDPLLTVGENLVLHGCLYGMSRSASVSSARSWADEMGVGDRWDDRVGALSGGLRRRVELARALLTEPSVLLMDEPEAGLDVESRGVLVGRATACARSGGLVVIATHTEAVAAACDRVVMLDRGRVVRDGSPKGLCSSLGEMVLTVGPECASRGEVEAALVGLTRVRAGDRGMYVGAGGAVRDRVASLIDAGVSVSAGPVTLEHVYLDAVSGVTAVDARDDGLGVQS